MWCPLVPFGASCLYCHSGPPGQLINREWPPPQNPRYCSEPGMQWAFRCFRDRDRMMEPLHDVRSSMPASCSTHLHPPLKHGVGLRILPENYALSGLRNFENGFRSLRDDSLMKFPCQPQSLPKTTATVNAHPDQAFQKRGGPLFPPVRSARSLPLLAR